MLKELNTAQKVLMIIIYCLTAVALGLGAFAIYQIATKEKPWTIGVTYATSLDSEEGQVPIIEVNIHSNKNNNGQAVYDMRINSYADAEGNGIQGFGIQCVGDWKIINNSGYEEYAYSASLMNYKEVFEGYRQQYGNATNVGQTLAFGDFYFYYTGDNGEIYSRTSLTDIPNFMLIDIDNSFYKLKLQSYSCDVANHSAWAWLPWVSDTVRIDTEFTWFEVFDVVMRSAINSNATTKYELFPLSLMDLSDFVGIQYKNNKGQYVSMEKTSETRNFFTINVNYSNDGLTNAEGSMFGMVQSSATWDFYSDTDIKEYWNAYSEIVINEKHVNYIFDQSKNGYIISIDEDFAKYLKSLGKADIKVTLNLVDLDLYENGIDLGIDIKGIDLKNFDFKISSFEITTDVSDFKVYNDIYCSLLPTLKVV